MLCRRVSSHISRCCDAMFPLTSVGVVLPCFLPHQSVLCPRVTSYLSPLCRNTPIRSVVRVTSHMYPRRCTSGILPQVYFPPCSVARQLTHTACTVQLPPLLFHHDATNLSAFHLALRITRRLPPFFFCLSCSLTTSHICPCSMTLYRLLHRSI